MSYLLIIGLIYGSWTHHWSILKGAHMTAGEPCSVRYAASFLLIKDFCQRVTIHGQEEPESILPSPGAGLEGTCLEGTILDVHGGKAVTSAKPGLLNTKPV